MEILSINLMVFIVKFLALSFEHAELKTSFATHQDVGGDFIHLFLACEVLLIAENSCAIPTFSHLMMCYFSNGISL